MYILNIYGLLYLINRGVFNRGTHIMYEIKNKSNNVSIKKQHSKQNKVENKILSNRIINKRDIFIKRFIQKVDKDNIKKHLENTVGERNPQTSIKNLNNTANYIRSVLRKYNMITKIEPFVFKKVSNVIFNNIIAYKKGRIKNKILIISSHYDTGKNTPGADDNASAVASMLEMVRLISVLDLEYTIQFAFFTLEEYSMIGSYYHTRLLKESNMGNNIIGAVVLDGLGYISTENNSQMRFKNSDFPKSNIGDFLAIIGNENSETLLKIFDYNTTKYTPGIKTEKLIVSGKGESVPDTRRSDHTPFWDNGFRSIMVTDTCQFRNPYIHTPKDTAQNINLNFLTESTKATLSVILDICMKRK